MLSTLVLGAVLCAADGGGVPDAGVAPRPVVAVLYFDNLTTDRGLDVLQKGLADMMVSDLVASGAVEVVEREKLQAVIDELQLQRTKYFDPASAVRMGHLLGAAYTVTGTMIEAKETLRLSVRLLENASSVVLVDKEVFGPKDQLFELQEKLAALLLSGMPGVKPSAGAVRGAGELKTLLSYSQAIDLADQGKVSEAAERIAALLQGAPGFELGKDRKADYAKRLRAATDARRDAFEKARRQLLASADAVLSARLKAGDPKRLTYRVLRAQCLGLGIRNRLTVKERYSIPEGREAEVRALLLAWRDAVGDLEKDLVEAKAKPWKWTVDPGDGAAAATLGLKPPKDLLAGKVVIVTYARAMVVLLGLIDLADEPFLMRPTLGELEPELLEPSLALVDATVKPFSAEPRGDELAMRALDAKGLGLYIHGRKDEAVKTWQAALERYPKSSSFSQVEGHLQEALEVDRTSQYHAEDERDLAKAIAKCDAKVVDKLLFDVGERKGREDGLGAVKPLVDEIVRTCADQPKFLQGLVDAYWLGFDQAGAHGDCQAFERYFAGYAKLLPERAPRVRKKYPLCPE